MKEKIIARSPREIIELMIEIQEDALYAEGASYSLHYDLDDTEYWEKWLTTEIKSEER